MTNKTLDVVAVGACYLDTNVESFPFSRSSLVNEELIGDGYELVLGGSAVNFCRLSQQLGLHTALIGMAGDDANGDTLENLLNEQGIQAYLIRQPHLLTNVSFNITNPEGEHIMFVAGTANAALNPEAVLPHLQQILPRTGMLYLGGCFKLKNFAPAFGQIADLATQHGTRLVVDHGRIPEHVGPDMLEAVKQLVLRADYYFPNREEFCQLWEVSEIEAGLGKLQNMAPQLVIIIKDGQRGAFYLADGSPQHAAAEKVEKIYNLTGAGDSFNAGVMAAIAKGQGIAEAVTYGCKIAAAHIQRGRILPPRT